MGQLHSYGVDSEPPQTDPDLVFGALSVPGWVGFMAAYGHESVDSACQSCSCALLQHVEVTSQWDHKKAGAETACHLDPLASVCTGLDLRQTQVQRVRRKSILCDTGVQ